MQIDPVQLREVEGGSEMYCPKCKTKEFKPAEQDDWESFKVWYELQGCTEIHTLCLICQNTHVLRTSTPRY